MNYSPLRQRRPLLGYGIAVLATVAATLLRVAVDPLVGSYSVPFITYFLAVVFVAASCGFRAAALTILLSVLAADYYFLLPAGSLLVDGSHDVAALLIFVVVSFAIAFLGSSRTRALERADRELELRQEAERLEREQRKRYETTLASIGDAVISTDAGGRITFANHVAQSLLRCPEAEMMGKHLDDVFQIINENSREKVESPVAKVLREGAVVGIGNHTVLIARDGAEIPIDDSGAPIRAENGAIQGMVLVFRDVTTRRRADEESRLLASIVESSDDAIISKDLSGTITSWNDGAQRIFEYSALEVIGQPISTIAAPDRRDEMPGILERIKQGERIDHFETVRRTKSGKLVNVSLTVSPVRDATGRIVGASKVARDITERLHTAQLLAALNSQLQESNANLTSSHEELQKARDLLKATLAGIGDAVISTDAEGRIVFANQVAQSLLRWPEAEMLGKHLDGVFRIINENSREKVESPVAKILREGAIVGLANHTVLIARDGTEVPIDDSGAPIRGESGTIQGTVLVFRDISERRQKENALRESEQRFQNLADGAPVLIWVCGPNEKCTWFNRPWLEFTGRTMEQELGDGWAEGIHADDMQRRRSTYKENFDRREAFSMEYRLRRHDGEWRWMLDTGMPLHSPDGTFLGYIGSCIDITERKKVEEERLSLLTREQAARSEAERANRLKDEFLATVSHELRTPLAAVLGWAQLLEDPTLDESTRERAIKTIQHNAKMQTKLLEDILDVSRVVSGKLLLEMQRVELQVVIDGALESIRPTAEAKGIRIERIISPESSVAWGDPERLEQVVRNLLSNAVKFTPEGGRVEVRLDQCGSLAEIQVRDWGEGITAEFLPYVFDPFRQADVSPSRRHGGLGLGLAIVHQVVGLHEGSVNAHSEGLGTGATFTVTIPLLPGAPARSEEGSESAAGAMGRLSGLRVLLVEDNADTRDMLAVLLQSHGAEVRAAASAHEALASFRLHRPDVLLCDIGLPLEDGFSLIRQIRSLRPEDGGCVPALALSAYTRFEDRQQALTAGFQMHLPKPINPLLVTRSLAELSRGGGATAEEPAGAQGSKRNFRVVVIDDAKDLADIFGILLREMGHEVHVFYDGLTALSQAGGIKPEIVFSDISMREMNGYELAKRLREMPGLHDVILVAITGFSQAEGGGHILRAGFDYHLVKPVLSAQLNEFFSRLPPAPAKR